jgi:predicted transcriptional regulator
MTMTESLNRLDMLTLATEIVSSYVANNTVPTTELPVFIQQVYHTITTLGTESLAAATRPKPFVPVNKSITDDYIVCLEDGKKLQMLKRHLKTVYNMSVEQYKERWGLPADYPVVSPNYAKRRSEIAKTSGLGMTSHRRKLTIVKDGTDTHAAVVAAK